jgi:hypothetical protein
MPIKVASSVRTLGATQPADYIFIKFENGEQYEKL